MVNRVLQQKALKRKRQLYARPRSITIPPLILPDQRVLKRHPDKVEPVDEEYIHNLHVTVIDNCLQFCRVIFNSRRDCYIIHHVNKRTGEVRKSITYGSMERALQVWVQSRVVWKVKKNLPA